MSPRIGAPTLDPVAQRVWLMRGGLPKRTMYVYLLEDDGGMTLFDAGILDMTPYLADAHGVAVAQAAAPGQALPVDVGAVPRQPVVHDRPVAAHPLELGVQARDLPVPDERDVAVLAASDRQAGGAVGQLHDVLAAVGVAEEDERRPPALGVQALLELDR